MPSSSRFYELVRGRPTVLVLVANTARQEQWDEIKGYADIAPALDAAGVDLFIVTNDGVNSMAMVSKAIPAPAVWLADIRGAVNLALRTGAKFAQTGVVSFVLDPDQRVIALQGRRAGPGRLGLLRRAEAPGRGAAGPGRHGPGPDPAPRPG